MYKASKEWTGFPTGEVVDNVFMTVSFRMVAVRAIPHSGASAWT